MPVVDEKIKVLDGGDPQNMCFSWFYPTVHSKNSIIYGYNFFKKFILGAIKVGIFFYLFDQRKLKNK